MEHSIHWCKEEKCPGTCTYTTCNKPCSLHHIHTGEDCDCGESHQCAGKCDMPGVCLLQDNEKEAEADSDRSNATPAATLRRCSVILAAGKREHSGSCDCGIQHTCLEQCTWCKSFCSLQHQHDESDHHTKHGRITDDALPAGLSTVFDKYGQPLISRLGASASLRCDEVCRQAGPSHSHYRLPVESKSESSLTPDAGVNGVSSFGSKHTLCTTRPEERLRHDKFWKETSFNEPSFTVEEAAAFIACPVVSEWPPCPLGEDEKHEIVPCDLGLFHKLVSGDEFMGTPGFVSTSRDLELPGHHFPKSHPCLLSCGQLVDQEKCKAGCSLGAGHVAEACHCDTFHRCGAGCSGRDCVQLCEQSSTEEHVCDCGGKECRSECDHKNCSETCDLEHPHQSEHDCGERHGCPEACNRPGICLQRTALKPGSDTSGQMVSRPCSTSLERHLWDHGEEHDCGEEHTCDTQCPLCHQYCSREHGHTGRHTTNHSHVIESEPQTIVLDRNEELCDTDAATCQTICSIAGPGHSHVITHGAGGCSGDREICRCTTAGVHHTTHRNFWRELNFEDPTTPEEQVAYARCHVHCNHQDHAKDGHPVLCSGDQWHTFFSDLSAFGGVGYVGTTVGSECQGHHFECDGHACDAFCCREEHANRKCCLGLGHSCSADCPVHCKGYGETHQSGGDVVHMCREDHTCLEPCAGTPGHCQQVLSANCSEPKRLNCQKIIPSGSIHHTGVHHHNSHQDELPAIISRTALGSVHVPSSTVHDGQHYCTAMCPMCFMACEHAAGHSGPHSTTHGTAIGPSASQFDLTKQWVVVTSSGKAVKVTDSMSCAEACAKVGRGHYHMQKCAVPNSCRLRNEHQALHKNGYHAVSHQLFWALFKFESPSQSSLVNNSFEKCGLFCPHPTHADGAVYCEREFHHPSTYSYDPVTGYRFTEQGCLLRCQHDCQGTCKF
eukprot:scpid34088/ scgid0126/ 